MRLQWLKSQQKGKRTKCPYDSTDGVYTPVPWGHKRLCGRCRASGHWRCNVDRRWPDWLVYAVCIPFYGRLGDLYGARPLFLFGVVLFSMGSIMAALATDFTFLMIARVVQAVGGSAVPGLGMTIASRACGQESRGMVMGVVAATIGAGGAVGPLLGGGLSELFGWEAIFVATGASVLTIPIAMKVLPQDEQKSDGGLDIVGGLALALLVGGLLLVPSEGARTGWTSSLVVLGVGSAAIGLLILGARQWTAQSPFIPTEFLKNLRYIALVSMSFCIMMANLAPLIGLPILLTTLHGLSPLEIGFVMLPGAALSSVSGVLAGRLTDWKGARLPAWLGAPLMLIAVLGLSTYADSSLWAIGAFAGLLGAGFGLVNTPPSNIGVTHRQGSDAFVRSWHELHAIFLGGQLWYGWVLCGGHIARRKS